MQNYDACQGSQFIKEPGDPEDPPESEDDESNLGVEVLESPYETLTLNTTEEKLNKITWDPEFRQRVYVSCIYTIVAL